MRKSSYLAVTLVLGLIFGPGAIRPTPAGSQAPLPVSPKTLVLCASCVHADMAFLADDELQGRGSGTRDEHIAALFAASLLESSGLEPGGDHGTFLQKIPLPGKRGSHAETWNVIGILRGSDKSGSDKPDRPDSKTREEAILLSAHIDHLGIGTPVNGDSIYNGADDDASGSTAVMELARTLSQSRPRRTLVFVLYGSEETGKVDSEYFALHPPIPLSQIVANLQFEMIGRVDPKVPRGDCWLTGYERSDLGPALAARGAPLVADPRPEEGFFARSDNYPLAQQGVVAQTISSFGLHADYHQPSDELNRIDFAHLDSVIASMAGPIQWLANTDWKPAWKPRGRPDN